MSYSFTNPFNSRAERGAAVLLELILVAAVLGLAGLALYQANHRAATKTAMAPTPTPVATAANLAAVAADTALTAAAADATLSTTAESATTTIDQSDTDLTNLGDTSNAAF